jgi:hypothetical protein
MAKTLRDEFAVAACVALGAVAAPPPEIAKMAHDVADAMWDEHQRREKERQDQRGDHG